MKQPTHNSGRLARSLTLCLALASFLVAILAFTLTAPTTTRASVSATSLNIPGMPTWGTDHVINPPPHRTPSRMFDQSMSINPSNPDRLVAAYSNTGDAPIRTDFASSTDAGQTWATGALTESWGLDGYLPFGDLNTAYDGHGTAFLSTLAISNTDSVLAVVTSTNGFAWNTPNIIASSTYTEYRALSSLAVDKRTTGPYAGNVYLAYLYSNVEFEPWVRGIWMRASSDGGSTWSPNDIQISDTEHYTSSLASAAVAPDGTVYVSFDFTPSTFPTSTQEIYLDRSTDGGSTWGHDRLVGGAPIQFAGRNDYERHELVLMVPSSCRMMRLSQQPVMAVSPLDSNTVYVAWTDSRWDLQDTQCGLSVPHGDIAFSKTTDGGLTWTSPARVNDDPHANGIDQFSPTISVAPDGTIGMTWYDRRYDPSISLVDLTYSQSTDGGATWSPNQRITDTSINPDALPNQELVDDLGYRKSLVFGPDYAISTWLDTRLGTLQGDFFIDRGTFPAIIPSNTPTNIPTSTPTTTPTSTPSLTPTSCPLPFSDVPENSPFYAYIHCLYCRGIIGGYPDNTFRPGDPVTRGQIAKIVSNAANFSDTPGAQQFEDVLPNSTFYDFIWRLADREIISGYPCGGPVQPCGSGNLPYFRPNSSVTRGQITKIVANAAGLHDPTGDQLFADVLPGSTFYDFVQRLANNNVMSGYPCGNSEPCIPPTNLPYFRPNAGATRGQVAKIVSNTFFPSCNPVKR